MRDLLAQITYNLLVGNDDAHSKNYSLAISDAATYSMAPLCDVAPAYLLNNVFQTSAITSTAKAGFRA